MNVLIVILVILIIYLLWQSIVTLKENLDTTTTKKENKDDSKLTAALRKTIVDNSVFDVPNDPSDYLILITATCSGYMDWQSLAAYERAKKVWPEAQIVRLLHCSKKDRETYKYKDIMPSMYTSDCSCQTRYKDCYPPLNRPVALKEFLDSHPINEIKQNWIVIMDSDTLLRKRLNYFPVYEGRPVAQLASVLMDKMYSAAKPIFKDHNSIIKQPLYDMGSPYILHKKDAFKMAPYWLKFTNDLREDKTTRDYIGWIVEMYSYIVACAYVGLDHIVRSDLQSRWPYTDTSEDVASHHYDLDQEKDGHKWSKRDYMKDLLDSDILMKTDDAPNEHVKDILTSINEALVKWRKNNLNK